MKQFVKKKVSFVMVMIMAVITVISMSLPMAVFAQVGGVGTGWGTSALSAIRLEMMDG